MEYNQGDADFSDTSSQCSRSSVGMSSLASGSASQFNRSIRQRSRPAPPATSAPMGDLFSRLEAAEKQLQTQALGSGRSTDSAESEERDKALVGETVLDELEKRSEASGKNGSEATTTQDPLKLKLTGGSQRSDHGSASQHSKPGSQRSSQQGGGPQSSSSSSSRSRLQNLHEKIEQIEAPKNTKDELLEIVVSKDDELRFMEQKMQAIEAKRSEDVENLNEVVEAKEKQKEEVKIRLVSEVKSLEVSKHVLKEQLVNTKYYKEKVKEEKDELQDFIAGLRARHEVELRKVEAAMRAKLAAEVEEEEVKRQEDAEAKKIAESEAAALAQQLQRVQKEKRDAVDERDVLRVTEAMTKAESKAKQAKVDLLRAELSMKAEEHAEVDEEVSEQPPKMALASRILTSVRETEQLLQEEMLELKKRMKGLDRNDVGYKEQMGELQSKWDNANMRLSRLGTADGVPQSAASSSSSRPKLTLGMMGSSSSRGSGLRGGWSGRPSLPSINEVEDLQSGDGSVAASGHFSSDANEGVGDLHDFDESVEDPMALIQDPLKAIKVAAKVAQEVKDKKILKEEVEQKAKEKQLLKEELSEKQYKEHLLQEEIAEKVAQDQSKIARLQWMLQMRHEEKEDAEEALIEMQARLEVKDFKIESIKEKLDQTATKVEWKDTNLELLRKELEEKKGKVNEKDKYIQELETQLESAWEARRLADARCEDYKSAMEALEARYEEICEDLRQEIRILKGSINEGLPEGEDLRVELMDLRRQVQKITEERNILQNVLEWKEVQWRSTAEDLEQQLVSQAAELKQEHERQARELRAKLELEMAQLRRRLGEPVAPTASLDEKLAAAATSIEASATSTPPSSQMHDSRKVTKGVPDVAHKAEAATPDSHAGVQELDAPRPRSVGSEGAQVAGSPAGSSAGGGPSSGGGDRS